jgi:hypothetical protein
VYGVQHGQQVRGTGQSEVNVPRYLQVLDISDDGGTIDSAQMSESDRTLEAMETEEIERDGRDHPVSFEVLAVFVFERVLAQPLLGLREVPVDLAGIEGVRFADLDGVDVGLGQRMQYLGVVEHAVDNIVKVNLGFYGIRGI